MDTSSNRHSFIFILIALLPLYFTPESKGEDTSGFISLNLESNSKRYPIPLNQQNAPQYIFRDQNSIYRLEDSRRIYLGKIDLPQDDFISKYFGVLVADINFDGKYEFLLSNISNPRLNFVYKIVDSNGQSLSYAFSPTTKILLKELVECDPQDICIPNPEFDKNRNELYCSFYSGQNRNELLLKYSDGMYRIKKSGTPGKAGGLKGIEPLKAVEYLSRLKAATSQQP
jgi:hypothetical protein